MMVKQINDQTVWNNFVYQNTQKTFHQSWQWGQMHKILKNRFWYYAIVDRKSILAVFLTIKIIAKRGVFLLVPHGPVFKKTLSANKTKECLSLIKEHLKKNSILEKCSFVRIAPILARTPENAQMFTSLGFVKSPIFVQAEQSLVLDITPDQQDILKQMRKSTRYILKKNINLDIKFTVSDNKRAFDDFFSLYLRTVKDKHFSGQQKDFIKAEYEAFGKVKKTRIYTCWFKKIPISSAMIILSDKTGYYHYGASDKKTNIPASHLLQWHIIKNLKKEGFEQYNFWGISPDNNPKHPWYGLSVFKKGFGGEIVEFVLTQDLVVDPFLYSVNWTVEYLRKTKRHY